MPRIVLIRPAVSSTSIKNACVVLTPSPGTVAPILPTLPNITRKNSAATIAPTNCVMTYPGTRHHGKLRLRANANVTAGFKCASAYRAHEIDDCHDHETRRHDDHVQSHFAITLCGDNVRPSGDNDEQECAPAFRKHASPFAGGIEELMFRPVMGLVTTGCRFCVPSWWLFGDYEAANKPRGCGSEKPIRIVQRMPISISSISLCDNVLRRSRDI